MFRTSAAHGSRLCEYSCGIAWLDGPKSRAQETFVLFCSVTRDAPSTPTEAPVRSTPMLQKKPDRKPGAGASLDSLFGPGRRAPLEPWGPSRTGSRPGRQLGDRSELSSLEPRPRKADEAATAATAPSCLNAPCAGESRCSQMH